MKSVVAFMLVLTVSGSAFALSPNAFMGTIDSDWATGGNWTNGAAPTTEDVSIRAAAVIAPSTAAFSNILRVGNGVYGASEVGSIVINGSLTTRYDIRIAEQPGVNGTVTVNAGAILDNRTSAAVGEFGVGYGGTGTLNVYGIVYTKSMDITNWYSPGTSIGTVNVFAGGVVVDQGRLTVGGSESWGGNGSLVIYPGGSFSCGDNWNSKLQSWIDRGAIRTIPGALLIVTNNSGNPGKTFTAKVIPQIASEPSPAISVMINDSMPVLSWKAGINAISHDIYFGTDINKIATAHRLAGDFNNDRTVNITDLSIFLEQWLAAPTAGVLSADFDASGDVDFNDFARLAGNWQASADSESKSNQTDTGYIVSQELTPGETYYWRVDEISNFGDVIIGDIWSFIYNGMNPKIALDAYYIAPNAHSAVTPASGLILDWWSARHQAILNRVGQGNVDLIFIGDSITHGWDVSGVDVWQQYYADRNAVNMGFNGDRTQHVLWRLNNGEIMGISPKLAIIMIGTNNAYGWNTAIETSEGIIAICKVLRNKLPQTKILILAIFPRFDTQTGAPSSAAMREINAEASKRASVVADNQWIYYMDINDQFLDENGALLVDLMPDLLHPGASGYHVEAEKIEPMVKKLMGENN